MKTIVCYAIGLAFAATHAFAGVAPAPKPFYAGKEQADAWGLYDMHGNVAEWCLDTMKPYSADAKTDPVVFGPGDKIIRGGGIGAPPRSLRSAARHAVPRDIDYYGMLGLRLVLAPKVAVETGK